MRGVAFRAFAFLRCQLGPWFTKKRWKCGSWYGAVLSLPVSLLLGWGVTELFEKPLAKRMRYKEAAPAP